MQKRYSCQATADQIQQVQFMTLQWEPYTSFYDNQVDDYTQDHFQFHWDEKINAFWSSSVGLNYTYGRGFYEEYNDVWYHENYKLWSRDTIVSIISKFQPILPLGKTTVECT